MSFVPLTINCSLNYDVFFTSGIHEKAIFITNSTRGNGSEEINPMFMGNPKTDTLANRKDPDEMQHNAAFIRV